MTQFDLSKPSCDDDNGDLPWSAPKPKDEQFINMSIEPKWVSISSKGVYVASMVSQNLLVDGFLPLHSKSFFEP
jgi:hypothetical protein